MVQAAGVELFNVLTARKLWILCMARRPEKARSPIPLYVDCTKILSRLYWTTTLKCCHNRKVMIERLLSHSMIRSTR